MTDITGIEVTDVFGLAKLADTIGRGIGKVYVKRMAKARAEEIKTISGAVKETNLATGYLAGEIKIDNNNFIASLTEKEQELHYAAEQRRVADNIRQERNLQNIVEKASSDIINMSEISEEQVESDWATRFFNIVKDINSEEMQIIWAKILAGEIKHPGTFSMRTLDTIRNLSKLEAEIFQKIIPLVVSGRGVSFIVRDNEILKKYGIYYYDIMKLVECGLLNGDASVNYIPQLQVNEAQILTTDDWIIKLHGKKNIKIEMAIYTLTNAGRELYEILNHSTNKEYLLDFMGLQIKKDNDKLFITFHEVTDIDETVYNYEDKISVMLGENKIIQ
ncbi:MAG: DUF2806 domain-containing protein [Peptococcaceae bacterium]|nr:DUF2806 domain-containing protein [Peptococcaceae bacterium]